MGTVKLTIVLLCISFFIYWLVGPQNSFDPAKLKGQRVIITGCSTGIGEELAYAYSRLGARILITARRQNLLETVAERCRQLGAQQVVVVAGDMAADGDRQRVIAEANKHFDGKLDHLILNHVICSHGHWKSTPGNVSLLRKAFEINYFSYVEIASLATEMLNRSGGRIGVMSSVSGKVPMAGYAYYASAKFALDGFFNSWRRELIVNKSNISITTCFLGLIATDNALGSIRQGYLKMEESQAVSVEQTAETILQAVTVRVPNLNYPLLASFAITLHRFLPDTIELLSAQMSF